jgi:hypothetical protein
MMHSVYRLTLDENGQEDCQDYTSRADGLAAFQKAKKRKSVYSARLEYICADGAHIITVRPCENFERA